MTEAALTVGSFLLAFGPLMSMFALIVYQKAQLVIIVTTAAFFFLLAATASSMTWYIFHAVGLDGPLVAILPSVFFQFLFRCAFTALYHKVERVIQLSLQKQHEEELKHQQHQQQQEQSDPDSTATTATTTAQPPPATTFTEAARLRLELNDGSAAIAAAVGFGGMNAVLLYGTLLASEATHNVGVLYQDSCPSVPTLAVSAVLTNFFSILQVFWMLLTFFGMRRRLVFHRGQSADYNNNTNSDGSAAPRRRGNWLGNSRNGGNWALMWTLLTHLAAALLTLSNGYDKGCRIALPAVGGTVLVTAYLFWAGCGRIYMPSAQLSQTQQQQQQRMDEHHRD